MKAGDPRLGIVAFLGGTAAVLFALVVLARYPTMLQRGPEYHAVFKSVPGLNLGDDVRYGGYLVGSITNIGLDPADPTRIRVAFRVRPTTPVRVDTRAKITQLGMLGQPYLNLTPGRADAAALPPKSAVPSEDNLAFADAIGRLGSFLDRADSLMRVAERLASAAPWQRVDRSLDKIDLLVIHAATGSDRVLANLEVASGRLNDVLARSERVVAGIDTTVKAAGPDLAMTQKEMVAAIRDLRALVGELRDATRRGDRTEDIMRNLAAMSENLARFTNRLDRNPAGTLLARPQPAIKTVGPRP